MGEKETWAEQVLWIGGWKGFGPLFWVALAE